MELTVQSSKLDLVVPQPAVALQSPTTELRSSSAHLGSSICDSLERVLAGTASGAGFCGGIRTCRKTPLPEPWPSCVVALWA